MPTLAPFRAVSTLILKSVDEDERVIEGVASSAATDAAGDQLLPKGAVYSLPMPLLMQHNRTLPVGEVTAARVTDTDITIRAKLARNSGLDYVDNAWKQLKAGLVRGLSIGAKPLKAEPIVDKAGKMTGVRYTAWRWLELSAVTLPMNVDATIEVVRAYDLGGLAFANRHDGRDPVSHDARLRALAALHESACVIAGLNAEHRAVYQLTRARALDHG